MIIFIKFLQIILRIVFLLPTNTALSIMYSFGWLTQAVVKKTRLKRTVIDNIKMVLPESQAESIANNLIKNVSYSVFEMICFPFFKKKHLQTIVKLQNLEYLDKAVKENMGVIIPTMHVGNYELICITLANLGFKMNAVLRATEDPIFEIVNKSRSAGGVKLINVLEENMFKETLKVLNKGEVVGMLADTGALESRYVFIEFLGKKVPAATGWFTLAQRAQCTIVPMLARREGRTTIATFFEPFKIIKETREDSVKKLGEAFNDFVSKYPEEWLIFLNPYETQRMVKGK
jgi:lauroyl/myristoyl acyltransferase